MRTCLVRPPILVPKWNQAALLTPPLGLAYVAGTLDAAGYDVSVVDAVGEAIEQSTPWGRDCALIGLGPDEVVERIPGAAQIIGVSAGFTFEWPVCRELLWRIRERFPEALLVVGGEHATAAPELTLAESPAELCVLGEGEETLLDIVRRWQSGRLEPGGIAGIAYRTPGGAVVRTARRTRIADLDSIPWPAWYLLPIEEYLDRRLGFGVDRGRSMPLLASRGCPYQCTFCSSPAMWTTRWSVRSVDNLLLEMQSYQRRWGVENFDFYDLTAIVRKSWIRDFCQTILDRGLQFSWQLPSGTRSEAIDEEIAPLLFAAGCRNLSYSPESGSPAVLARIKKRIEPVRMLESMKASVRSGINIKCNLMLGFPGETWRELAQSLAFVVRMAWAGAHDLSIWAFSPYPGSELFDELHAAGQIQLDDEYYDRLRSYADASATRSLSEHLGDRQLHAVRWLGVLLFYLTGWLRRPWRPIRLVANLLAGRQESRGELALHGALARLRRSVRQPARRAAPTERPPLRRAA